MPDSANQPNPAPHAAMPPGAPPVVGRVWADAELDRLHADADKSRKVRDMFAAIAGRYDLNNRVHSLCRDQAWRREAVRQASVRPGDAVLDVACGTGDLTQAFAKTRAARVVGLDFTAEMLDIARRKQHRTPHSHKITYVRGDATALPQTDASFDVVSIAFGIRNVQQPERAIPEFARVLRPGGRLIVLEFETPRNPLVRRFNDFYAGWLMPRTATLIAGDRSGAYRYLPKSVAGFMSREELNDAVARTGFETIRNTPLSLGIAAITRAVRTG